MAAQLLIDTVKKLSLAREVEEVVNIVRHAARTLTGADGATFILRDGDKCHYVDEDAVAPLWKGKRFPMKSCISGWVMLNKNSAIIQDIYSDPRIPADAYRPTFVKSLAMVPIRKESPLGAIGNYWASNYQASDEQIEILQSLADSTCIALESINAYKELKRQIDLRDNFLTLAGHELRTPLVPMVLKVQTLHRLIEKGEFTGHPREKELEKCLYILKVQLKNFSELVEKMLDIGRIGMEQLHLQRLPNVSLVSIVQKLLPYYKTMNQGPITLEIIDDVHGHWDPHRVEQVVANLIANAVKYGQGGPVKISVSNQNNRAIFIVEDSGPGIRPEDESKIFQRFEGTCPKGYFGGLGLGLFICHHVLKEMGGEIHVDGRWGQGARFTVELPV